MRRLIIFGLLLCFVQQVTAQVDCPAFVDAAFAATDEACANLERNQACYGNVSLNATPREDVSDFTFEQAGDVANVADIDTLQLSSMSLTEETWGIALMLLQANLPDTLPGQNVAVVLFGDVTINSADDELVEIQVSATANVNVRLRPTTSENNVIASLSSGETLTANGRLEDESWVRVVLDAETEEVGWVSADFVSSDSDLATMTVVSADGSSYGPMQAFYFASAIGDSQCDEAPDSGLLIQSPYGVGRVNLVVNQVQIDMGSTLYLQAGGGFMTVSVLQGSAALTASGVTQVVPQGAYARIPLDSSGVANGAPEQPQPYNANDVAPLDTLSDILMPARIITAPPADEDSIADAPTITDGLPVGGTWTIYELIADVEASGCTEPVTVVEGSRWSYVVTMTFSEDYSSMTWVRHSDQATVEYTRIDDLVYISPGPGPSTITFTSPITYSESTVPWRPDCYVVFSSNGVYSSQ